MISSYFFKIGVDTCLQNDVKYFAIVNILKGDDFIFKEKERYFVFNGLSEYHKYFLTIMKVDRNTVYYCYDGDDEVRSFDVSSSFAVDLIKAI